MAQGRTSLTKLALILFVAACGIPSGTGCSGAYESIITDLCLIKFTLDMEVLEPDQWCTWPQTVEPYGELVNCTYFVALEMGCFWPNQVIDHFFVHIHRHYFHNCALTGRLLRDPPIHILGPFIAVPVLVTLLMTALVVWRSKRSEGIL